MTNIQSPVTLFAQIDVAQHEELRAIALEENRSLDDLVRQALDDYLNARRLATATERLDAHELALLASKLQAAQSPEEVARLRERLTRGFYGS